MPGKIAVEVAYALPEKQYLQRVTLQEGATVEEAIRASGLLPSHCRSERASQATSRKISE